MKRISYDEARRNFSKVFSDISEKDVIVAIERPDGPSVAVLSLAKYTSMSDALLGTRNRPRGGRKPPRTKRLAKQRPTI